MIRAVLFDIDGTLIDSNELHVAAWQQVFAEAGYTIETAAIHQQIGKGGDNLVPALLPQLSAAMAKQIADAHDRVYRQVFLPQAKPIAGAVALLRHVHAAGRKVVLASSASQQELDHYVELMGVRDIVVAGTSSDDVATSKPAPDIFAAALAKTGIGAEEAMAVGDTPYDAEAAAKSGIATIGLLSGGFAAAELREAGMIALYADAAALLAGYDGSPLAR